MVNMLAFFSNVASLYTNDGNVKCYLKKVDHKQKLSLVVAQLAERSLPTPEDTDSNPVISKFY